MLTVRLSSCSAARCWLAFDMHATLSKDQTFTLYFAVLFVTTFWSFRREFARRTADK